MRDRKRLSERYISTTNAAISNPSNLPVLSDDAFAQCEFMEELNELINSLNVAIRSSK